MPWLRFQMERRVIWGYFWSFLILFEKILDTFLEKLKVDMLRKLCL